VTGSAALYTLSLVDVNTTGSTNDFVVDDITVTSGAGQGVIVNHGTLQATGGALTELSSGTMKADVGA
jgi:hypothetical protein